MKIEITNEERGFKLYKENSPYPMENFRNSFLSKFLFATPTWKVYIRTVILYAIILVNYKNKNLKQIASSMIILDAVMGLQSRFIQSNISRLL